ESQGAVAASRLLRGRSRRRQCDQLPRAGYRAKGPEIASALTKPYVACSMTSGARRNIFPFRSALKTVSRAVRHAVGYLCVLVLIAVLTVIASAQTTEPTTRVTGTVRSSGLPIPGATVTARQGDR